MTIGDIMSISRLRMGTDGKGVTTLVAFFDCPLHCKYCINYFCHEFNDGEATEDYVHRGSYSPQQLLDVLQKDDIYYKMSGGGVTFGGGEPLLQSSFIHEVCAAADPDWKVRIETSLNVPWRYIHPIIDDIDEWIIDIKDMDWWIYKAYTGKSITRMLNNLERLSQMIDHKKIHIRIPQIPGYNNEDNIQYSIQRVKEIFSTDPEIFTYSEIQLKDWNIHLGE